MAKTIHFMLLYFTDTIYKIQKTVPMGHILANTPSLLIPFSPGHTQAGQWRVNKYGWQQQETLAMEHIFFCIFHSAAIK